MHGSVSSEPLSRRDCAYANVPGTAGHCGPKNNIQDQGLYCGDGCQEGFGECVSNRAKPPNPAGTPGTAQNGETCGPIVNKRCATGLCCSGSNFCGYAPPIVPEQQA